MPDIIHLLPDSVANQIAAGEVVQRPASAVKELLENSIDAKATEISLVVKNAGKTLLQVIDNGIGMTETDARLSLERHATSKITKVEDLFALTTMGFRGEAVPSIAAVSQLEVKTKPNSKELGSHLILEGSTVISQEPCQCKVGTNISVKNLFFNIPARRNFLKSNPVETKHIIEEFLRVALIHPEVVMKMTNDQSEVYHLPKGSFRQRIVSIYGEKYNQRLVPVKEDTDIVKISGFVGKPEFARRTRGEQYFFVNNRFIRSPYLNHAIQNAFEELLPKDQFPSYYLRMDIDPSKIDINIHPTKTEIKFEEERSIYAILRTSVKQALGKFNIAPSLDFERENSFDVPMLKKGEAIRMPNIEINPEFNPFESTKKSDQPQINFPFKRESKSEANWQNIYDSSFKENQGNEQIASNKEEGIEKEPSSISDKKLIQLHRKYILNHIKSGFIIVDQNRAHQRILIDQLIEKQENKNSDSQQLLFPEDLEVSAEDAVLINSLLEELMELGFDIRSFGKNHFIVQGIPSEANNANARNLIESLLEEFKANLNELKNNPKQQVIYSLARSMSIKSNQSLSDLEMSNLIDELFACQMPYSLPNGKPIIVTYSLDDLDKQFMRR